jgi:hypothetical protein
LERRQVVAAWRKEHAGSVISRAIEQFARIRGRFTTSKSMPAVFNVIGGFALHLAAEQLGHHSGSIYFLEGEKI